jgi:hypothetical protein
MAVSMPSQRPPSWRRPDRGRLVTWTHRVVCDLLVRLRWGRQRHALTLAERTALEQLRRDVSNLTEIDGAVAPEWASYSRRLIELIESDDPRRFFSWDVVQWSLAATLPPFARHWLAHLKVDADYRSYWRPALRETEVGRPVPYPLAPFTSANRIVLAHHLHVLRSTTGRAIDEFDLVFEFGGGYGGLDALARSLGFDGPYIIIDLPALRALQRFYLALNGTPSAASILLDLTELDEADALLRASQNALFVATWSLSESPQSVRDVVLKKLPSCTHAVVTFQQSFGDIDNREFFDWLTSSSTSSGIRWERIPVDPEHRTPGLANDWYAIGVRDDG